MEGIILFRNKKTIQTTNTTINITPNTKAIYVTICFRMLTLQ